MKLKYLLLSIMGVLVLVALLAGGAAVSPVSAASAGKAVDPIVAAVRKRYAGIEGIQADFVQTLSHKQSGRAEKREGVFYFAKPMNVRWEVKKPVPEIQLVTAEAIWNAFPDEDMAYKYTPEFPKELLSVMDLITGQSALNRDFDVESGGTDKGIATLLLYPKADNANSMNMAELSVDAGTGEIKRVVVVDFFHNRNDMEFTAQTFNPKLPEGIFTFTPTKGMKVEDKTKDGAAGKPLLQ